MATSTFFSRPLCQTMSEPKRLNNEACCLIQTRNYNEAIVALKRALQVQKRASDTSSGPRRRITATSASEFVEDQTISTPPTPDVHPSPQHSPEVVVLGDDMIQTRVDHPRSSHVEHSITSSPSSTISHDSYVYMTPLFFSATTYREEPDITLFFVLMFNIGLAYHLKSLEPALPQEPRQLFATTAKRLYELTLQLQTQERVQTSLILTSALINNLSKVNASLDMHNEARQCDDQLLCALILILDGGGASTTHEKAVLEGLMDNVMHLILVQPAVAAAA